MNAERYSISQLVADLKQVCARFTDERDILKAVRPLARRAALSRESWLEDRMYRADAAQGFGVHLLTSATRWADYRAGLTARHDLAAIEFDDASHEARLLHVVKGAVAVSAGRGKVSFQAGDNILLPAEGGYSVHTVSETTVLLTDHFSNT